MDHPNVAMTLHNLAALNRMLQKIEDAIVYQYLVIEIWTKTLPADHPNTAIARRVLAVLLQLRGETVEADKLEEQGVQVLRKQHHGGDAAEALQLTKAGDAAFESGNFNRAGSLYEEALAAYEATLGPDHADVAKLWNHMARVTSKLGRENEAAVYRRRAERILAATK